MTWPAVVLWVLIIVSMMSRGPALIYLSAVAISVQSLQMIPGELVGNTNFLPGSVCAVFLAVKILTQENPNYLLAVALDYRRLGILFAFYIWCLFSAFLMPRLFAGRVEVITMTLELKWPVMLQPTAANITQPAYLTISIFSALAGYCAAKQPIFVRHWLKAAAVGGIALLVTGLADLILASAGQAALLDPFRNSSHALILDDQIAGSKRVIGLMDEASAYGSTCVLAVASLTFLRPCFEPLWRDRIVPLVIVGLIALALLSTSSTAYAGLLVFGMLYAMHWIYRAKSRIAAVRSGVSLEAALVVFGVLLLMATVAFNPSSLDPFNALLDEVVFNKTSSSSFEERGMWTTTGLNAFYGTYGLGVGFGSARTSNWFVAELSNTGLIGSALLAAFILFTLSRRATNASWWSREVLTGLKLMSLPLFAMNALAGTTPDVSGTFVYGMIISLSEMSLQKSRRVSLLGRSTSNDRVIVD